MALEHQKDAFYSDFIKNNPSIKYEPRGIAVANPTLQTLYNNTYQKNPFDEWDKKKQEIMTSHEKLLWKIQHPLFTLANLLK